jgi:hypothetical protein
MEKMYKMFWDERYHMISFALGYMMYGMVR